MNFQNAERVVLKWLQENPRFSLLLSDERENRFYFEVPEITRQFHITLPSSRYGSLQIDSEDELSRKFLRTAKKLCTKRYDLSLQELLNSLLSSDMFYQKMYPSQQMMDEDDESDEEEEEEEEDSDHSNGHSAPSQGTGVQSGIVAEIRDDEAVLLAAIGRNEPAKRSIEEGPQEESDSKRAKLTLSDTTLHDLPVEVLESILLQSVLLEVKGKSLAKSLWRSQAELVMSRLGNVCLKWNLILKTNFFRNKLFNLLDSYAPETVRVMKLLEIEVDMNVVEVAVTRDEVYFLFRQNYSYSLSVYDRNIMSTEPVVVPLNGLHIESMATCSISGCVYLLCRNTNFSVSILRITREGAEFVVATFIDDLKKRRSILRTTASGSVMIQTWEEYGNNFTVEVFNADGTFQYLTIYSPNVHGFRYVDSVIRRKDGNFLLVSVDDNYKRQLILIARNGLVLQRYVSSFGIKSLVSFADELDSIVVSGPNNNMELLDSHFNPLQFVSVNLVEGQYTVTSRLSCLHYNVNRNEVVRMYEIVDRRALVIFRFTGELATVADEADNEEDGQPVGQD